jgi:NhaC family Na+:H+ antiporter
VASTNEYELMLDTKIDKNTDSRRTDPTLVQAVIPTACLILLLSMSVYLFGDESSAGPNQIALCVGAIIAGLIGWKNGLVWKELEASIVSGISIALGAIMILFAVGSLIGSWIMSGTVPTMIYYGLIILDADIFYVATCFICAFVSLSIGSSWTVAGTIGVALIGTAAGLGLSLEITAGAIISGAYFGDKMSPLSDTTNLAPAVVGTDLFVHIQHMMWTTVPSICIALVVFTFLGIAESPSGVADRLDATLLLLDENFVIHPFMLAPLAVLLIMAMKRYPALPVILTGALVGCIFAVSFQQAALLRFVNEDIHPVLALIKGTWQVLYGGYVSNTGNETMDDLLSRGGMGSMLSTVWLILTAMIFGAVMDAVGLLARLVEGVLSYATTVRSLIFTTVATSIGINVLAADQYIAIVLPGRMYKLEFQRQGLDVKNLSRTLEDAGTITSPLVPWNTCGAYMSATLGVATLAYLPYCLFNLINPCVAILYGITGFKIALADEKAEGDGAL